MTNSKSSNNNALKIAAILALIAFAMFFGFTKSVPASASVSDETVIDNTTTVSFIQSQSAARPQETPAASTAKTQAPSQIAVATSQLGYKTTALDVTDADKRNQVKRAISTRYSQFRQCAAEGSVIVRAVIANGRTSNISVSSTNLKASTTACIAREFAKITFSSYDRGIDLSYPMSFVRQIDE